MMPLLEDTLYRLSNALLVPVLVAVLGLAVSMLALVGGLLREWLGRGEVRLTLRELRQIAAGSAYSEEEILQCLAASRSGLPARLHALVQRWPSARDRTKCLEDLELETAAHLARLGWITRIAPMLGLMGTLIPLGPALQALASGDIARLSSNLVVAFTTTVVGVFLGCAAFSISLLRKSWYERDLSDLEHIFPQPHLPHAAPKA
jgi:biopolymer transport protein ExbB/TolQ